MITTYTPQQEEAIEEKIEQLQRIIDGTLKPQELAEMIRERRLSWLRMNRHLLNPGLPLLQAAYQLLIHNHMGIKEGITMEMVSPFLLKIESRNFCPYLEACERLNRDTRFVCEKIGEPSINAFLKAIDRRLHFSRDYNQIRPYSPCCLEFVGVR